MMKISIKNKRFFKTKFFIFTIVLLLGVVLILELAASSIYYQRNGKYKFAVMHIFTALNLNDKNPDQNIPVGRWRNTGNNKIDTDLTNEIQKLQSIGYFDGSQQAPDKQNVTIYDKNRSYRGLNLVVSGHAPEAILMNMEGQTVHKWKCDAFSAWPDFDPNERFGGKTTSNHLYWRRAFLMENGDLLAIFEGIGLIKLDKDSNVLWSKLNGAHHDLHIAKNGDIYVLTRTAHINKEFKPKKPILEDYICILNSDGRELKKISLLELIENSNFEPILKKISKDIGDIFHTNTIELIENQPDDKLGPFKKETVLLSILNLNFVCAVDLEKGAAYWGESNLWFGQHQPTLLPNGNVLVFNNNTGVSDLVGESGVLEFDPNTRDVVWQYKGTNDNPFYTPTCGSCQRLPNKNTLIVESDPGRAFEVSSNKEIVWEYINPNRAGDENQYIATLFDVVRLDKDFTTTWLTNND